MRSGDSGETWGKSGSHPFPASLHTPGRRVEEKAAEDGGSEAERTINDICQMHSMSQPEISRFFASII